MNVEIYSLEEMICFWLMFTQLITFLIQTPLFDHTSLNTTLKILVSFVMTFAFYPLCKDDVFADMLWLGKDSFLLLTLIFSIRGFVLGIVVKLIMSIFVGAGSMISQQMGFSMIRYFDPQAQQSVGPIEQLVTWSMTILLLQSMFLTPLLKGILLSFDTFSIAKLSLYSLNIETILGLVDKFFSATLLLASPLIFTNVFIMVILGLVARTVPQMNILMVSFVVNIGLGLIVLLISNDEFFFQGLNIYESSIEGWFHWINKGGSYGR